ncbi:RNA-directed DNA polymerase, eukaryota [Tanacetum coccineum]|uniref:RNA-directed DNA polymerase, eukaryota n=1 Tax=Tanacetum coccineum TaxID=301880 RepID=A0ABQ5GGC8_9ASTR
MRHFAKYKSKIQKETTFSLVVVILEVVAKDDPKYNVECHYAHLCHVVPFISFVCAASIDPCSPKSAHVNLRGHKGISFLLVIFEPLTSTLEGWLSYRWLTLSDRFLVSENLLISCPNITAITLDRYLSDHRPILLRESRFDYGPIPFRFYHHWIKVDGFSSFVARTWSDLPGNNSNDMCNLMSKLKSLKVKIREWNKHHQNVTKASISRLKEDLKSLDMEIDIGKGTTDMNSKRAELIISIQEIDKIHSMELAQKAKINWCIEGDENSHFFHGMINKRRSQMSIRGIMIDGFWTEDPCKVKCAFYDHFSSRFTKPVSHRATLNFQFPKTLNLDQRSDLEREVTKDEIKLRLGWAKANPNYFNKY